MLFRSLKVKNFRGIKNFSIEDLTGFVMIAGPNGCGKSCVFDAIRLLKSLYGGYHPNEWHHFFAELQIDLNDPVDIARLFRDSSRAIEISARIELAESERTYLTANATALLESYLWMKMTGQDVSHRKVPNVSLVVQSPEQAADLRRLVDARMPIFLQELAAPYQQVELLMDSGNSLFQIRENSVASLIFATYDPDNLGIVEYHSASRAYQREAVGGIDLNVRNFDEQRRQSILYNSQNKYSNIKTELATTYLRDLVSKEAGQAGNLQSANETIKEMFLQFFPDKKYLGVAAEPGGTLSFPVRLTTGETHDINELSSGEKELVYGYLRLKNSAPRNCTILLDEPELHLNPSLLRGLVRFYHQNLGALQGNQLWLVTHSDALLRQAVGNSEYSVFHMTSPQGLESENENQAVPVIAEDDLERATIAIVGDLASYKPSARVVIVEGGGDTDFDAELIKRLAPDFAKRVNIVSGGDKRGVQALYRALDSSGDSLGSKGRFFAVVDRDFEIDGASEGARILTWDVYHIENFLLDDRFIMDAANALLGIKRFTSSGEVGNALLDAARKVVDRLVYDRVRKAADAAIMESIKIGGQPDSADPAAALRPSIYATFERLTAVRDNLTQSDNLSSMADHARTELSQALADGSWRHLFPGRRVLKRFAGDVCGTSASYEILRNLVIAQMERENYCPEGMRSKLEEILAVEIAE